MAMSKCKECGAEISTKAKACPKCGASNEGPSSLKVVIVMVSVFFVVGVIADGCSNRSGRLSSKAAQEKDREFSWVEKGKGAISARLKDPASAEFRNTFYSKSGNVHMTCGEVNSKNSFGGYAGFQRFISAGDASTSFLESDVKDFDVLWQKMCAPK